MAKSDKKQEKAIIENLPVASSKWIKQPWNLTFVKGEMTLRQLDIFVTLVERLQERINKVLSGESECLFDDSEYDMDGKVQVRVPLSSVTDNTNHYSEVASAAYRLYNLNHITECIGDDGLRYMELTHLFESIKIPETEENRREGNIYFTIHRDMVDRVFDLKHYTRYIKDIARSFCSAYTGRLYMYMLAYKGIGEWTVEYNDLREMLGCRVWEHVEEKKKEEWVEKKYPKYRNFRDRVLEEAKKELRALAETNSIDCYFDYTPIKAEGRGILEGPQAIRFKIYVTDYGKRQSSQLAENSLVFKFENILRNVHGLKTSQVKSILNMVKEDNVEFLLERLEAITNVVLSNKEEIQDVRKYIYTSLKNALAERGKGRTGENRGKKALARKEPAEAEAGQDNNVDAGVVVQNGCTEAVEWFWKAKKRHNVDDMNTMIGALNYAIDSQLPDYDKRNLINHMKMYYSIVDEFPTPPRIISFIKQQIRDSGKPAEHRATYVAAEPVTGAADVDESLLAEYRRFVELVSEKDSSFASVFLTEECSSPLRVEDEGGKRKLVLRVPSSFVRDHISGQAGLMAEALDAVFGKGTEIEYVVRGI